MMVYMIGWRMTLTKKSLIFSIILFSTILPKNFIDQLGPPWGYVFTDWAGPPLDIINYIPPGASEDTPILIVIPGASRDAQRFHASWLNLAKKKHFSVLTIGASKKNFPDEYSYNAGGIITPDGELIEEDLWLFSVIEPIFLDFKNRYGFRAEKFYLFGHSAGGGFVHRYLLYKPRAPVFKAVAANPAFVTLPDSNTLYPFGVGRSPAKQQNIREWFGKNMAIVLGGNDTGPRTKPLSNGPYARAQGPNCLSRGKLLYEKANSSAKDMDTRFSWELVIVPGVGHDNYNLAEPSSTYLFGE